MRLLFQGDSVTDWYRERSDIHNLGSGYAMFAAQLIAEYYPEISWEFINKGVSGDRTKELLARWQEDCIGLKPDILSIMIGINDTWRGFDSNDPTSAETYEANYRRLLEDVKAHTHAKIIMMEPYLLPTDPKKQWRADLSPKIDAARRLAREFADVYIPLDGLFAAACVDHEPAFFSDDGVHPTEQGAKFIAQAYLNAMSAVLAKMN